MQQPISVIFILSMLTAQAWAVLPTPYGANLPAVAGPNGAALAPSITEAFQFGPGVWSTPGLYSLVNSTLLGKFSYLNPTVPAYSGGGNPPSPLIAALPAENFFAGINDPTLTPAPFGPAVAIQGQSYNFFLSLSALYSPDQATFNSPNFNVLTVTAPTAFPTALPASNMIQLGFFSSSAATPSGPAPAVNPSYQWTQDYLNLYNKIKPTPFLAKQSRGSYLISQLQDYTGVSAPFPGLANSDQDYFDRQILYRHNHQLASFRALGLNPMWPNGSTTLGTLSSVNLFKYPAPAPTLPPLAGPPFAVPGVGQVPDNVLNLQAKFYYQQSYKHVSPAFNYGLDEMGFLYQIFAATLAYESGWVNTRYVPLDPSCRNPSATSGSTCVFIPPTDAAKYPNWAKFKARPYEISFGSASDFVNVYNVLKYFSSAWGGAQTMATSIASGASFSPVNLSGLKTAVQLRLGVPYPTTLNEVVNVASIIFNRAMGTPASTTGWNTLFKEGVVPQVSQSALVAPRVSAAFVAAATLAGKKVDPVFWGTLAEAEQVIMKNNPASYPGWAAGLFANQAVINDFGLSLTDFGILRPIPLAGKNPIDYVKALNLPGAITGAGLYSILNSAKDSGNGAFALVRGPNGLVSLTSSAAATAEEFVSSNNTTVAVPYPNAFIEVAATGRAIIDGRIRVNSDGSYDVFDVNDAKTLLVPASKYLLPFELEIITAYGGYAAQLWAAPAYAAKAAALGAITRAQSGNGSNEELTPSLTYGLLKGSYQPVGINPNDSRYFQPTLNFWLIVSEKMGNIGIPPAPGVTPPKLATVSYNQKTRTNYTLMNILSVTITPPPAPTQPIQYNLLPMDLNKPTFTTNYWYQNTANLINVSINFPFFTPTNSYLYATGSGIALPPLSSVIFTGPLASVNPAPPVASGVGSVTCHVIAALPKHDPLVKCPQ